MDLIEGQIKKHLAIALFSFSDARSYNYDHNTGHVIKLHGHLKLIMDMTHD